MDRMERIFQSHAIPVEDRANRRVIETERKLRLFIEENKVKKHKFEGQHKHSVLFTIVDSDNVCIQVQNIDPVDAPIYELSMYVLLKGILECPEVDMVKDYASVVEKSEVRRTDRDNTTSWHTKYYFALHKAFLKNTQ